MPSVRGNAGEDLLRCGTNTNSCVLVTNHQSVCYDTHCFGTKNKSGWVCGLVRSGNGSEIIGQSCYESRITNHGEKMEIYFDGGCRPNPGAMQVAVVISCLGLTCHENDLGQGTNNQAEWLALIFAMGLAKERALTNITLVGDSKLVISQAQGVWKCNQPELKVFLAEFRKRKKDFASVELIHVRRHLNLAGIYLEQR